MDFVQYNNGACSNSSIQEKKNCGHAVMIFADGGTQKTIKQNTDLYYVNEGPMLLVVTILVWYE